jgi:hypothetical protein
MCIAVRAGRPHDSRRDGGATVTLSRDSPLVAKNALPALIALQSLAMYAYLTSPPALGEDGQRNAALRTADLYCIQRGSGGSRDSRAHGGLGPGLCIIAESSL